MDKDSTPTKGNYWAPLADQVKESEVNYTFNLEQSESAQNPPTGMTTRGKVQRSWDRTMQKQIDERLKRLEKLQRINECGSMDAKK